MASARWQVRRVSNWFRGHLSRLRRFVSHFIQHVRDDWPATVFVAAALALLDHRVGWLDAINAHSFLLIGNAAEMPTPARQTNAKALVVVIDQFAAQSRYFERSPLYRCQLESDLKEVYAAMRRFNDRSTANDAKKLDLLVIDLDLSPARWLATELGSETPEAGCESRLHQLIVDEAKEKSHPIRTVLMNPFDQVTADGYTKGTHAEWRTLNATPNVTFGSAALPLEYGLVIKQYCDADTLAAKAVFARTAELPIRKENCVDKAIERKLKPRTKKELIDPRKYLAGVVAIATAVPGNQESELLSSRLDQTLTDDNFVAVFFGAAFGDEDAFLTPLGDLYGIEIHAASYLSLLQPLRGHELAELLVDIVFGFVFGYFIAWCWKRYFELKLSNDSAHWLYAPFYLLALAGGVCVIAGLLTVVSWALLVCGGIWASPIPMAVGMVTESFVSGSVAQGIDVASALKGETRPPRRTFRESAKKFFGGDFLLLFRKGKNESARLLATRLVIWMLVVFGAVLTAWFA